MDKIVNRNDNCKQLERKNWQVKINEKMQKADEIGFLRQLHPVSIPYIICSEGFLEQAAKFNSLLGVCD